MRHIQSHLKAIEWPLSIKKDIMIIQLIAENIFKTTYPSKFGDQHRAEKIHTLKQNLCLPG